MLPELFVPDEWLRKISGKEFLYPSAWYDCTDALEMFGTHVRKMTFCDTFSGYGTNRQYRDHFQYNENIWDLQGRPLTTGDPWYSEERRVNPQTGRKYRFISPSSVERRYIHAETAHQLTVNFRRGFGQYAVMEMISCSLGVFMHRGDSNADGGSGVCYLANVKKRHEPLSNLLDKIEDKFGDYGLVVTDGSGCAFYPRRPGLMERELAPHQAFEMVRDHEFQTKNFRWEVIGHLRHRYGPTLVFGLTRMSERSSGSIDAYEDDPAKLGPGGS